MSFPLWLQVQGYRQAGLNCMPLLLNGSKAPKLDWTDYQHEPLPDELVKTYFCERNSGIGIMCGSTSGNLEVLDFDAHQGPNWDSANFTVWVKAVEAHDPTLLDQLPIVATPAQGLHIYFRCEVPCQETVLARDCAGETLIEVRRQGHYVVAPGSPSWVHETRIPYHLLRGSLLKIPTITAEQRKLLFEVSKSFNQFKPAPVKPRTAVSKPKAQPFLKLSTSNSCSIRPGDDFNQRATWPEILEPHGWEILRELDEETHWRRPGSDSTELHATTNHEGSDLLHVFSTNISSLAPGSYTKFTVLSVLNFNGNQSQAASDLAQKGFGNQGLSSFFIF